MQNLEALGWTDAHQAWLAGLGGDAAAARVAAVERGGFLLSTADASLLARLGPRFSETDSALDRPTVGDWVTWRQTGGTPELEQVMPRSSCFVRKAAGRESVPQLIAANVDRVFVVTAAGDDFSARRMQRYAAAVWAGGAEPVLVINKSDRSEDALRLQSELQAAVPRAQVVVTSALAPAGLSALEPLLVPRTTIALVGSSGVGKSTIVNRLLGSQQLATANVRASDDKGRHTTTRRELLIAPSGVILIDTPGMREIALWDADQGVAEAFADVEELARSCRFRDCRHAGEPGCALLGAVSDGRLPAERLASYRSLSDEIDRTDKQRRQRSIGRAIRQYKKIQKKLGRDDD